MLLLRVLSNRVGKIICTVISTLYSDILLGDIYFDFLLLHVKPVLSNSH